MDYYLMTDAEIADDLGRRLNKLRLRKNLTQERVAEQSGLSVTAIRGAEKGTAKLMTYIKILRVLDSLHSMDAFLPDIGISPIEVARAKGKVRQRAAGKRQAK